MIQTWSLKGPETIMRISGKSEGLIQPATLRIRSWGTFRSDHICIGLAQIRRATGESSQQGIRQANDSTSLNRRLMPA